MAICLSIQLNLPKIRKGAPAIGIAMRSRRYMKHRHFTGTPSLVINNTNWPFLWAVPGRCYGEPERRQVTFSHNPSPHQRMYISFIYVGSVYQSDENSIVNLGKHRNIMGHLPDYSYIRYVYLPAWGGYKEIIKDNPHDYECAFARMACLPMSYLRGEVDAF